MKWFAFVVVALILLNLKIVKGSFVSGLQFHLSAAEFLEAALIKLFRVVLP